MTLFSVTPTTVCRYLLISSQIYKNDDADPEKMIKKKKFMEKNNVEDMTELLGMELDMESEFNKLDGENKEKVDTSHVPQPTCMAVGEPVFNSEGTFS